LPKISDPDGDSYKTTINFGNATSFIKYNNIDEIVILPLLNNAGKYLI
jgi:hypothetical protein